MATTFSIPESSCHGGQSLRPGRITERVQQRCGQLSPQLLRALMTDTVGSWVFLLQRRLRCGILGKTLGREETFNVLTGNLEAPLLHLRRPTWPAGHASSPKPHLRPGIHIQAEYYIHFCLQNSIGTSHLIKSVTAMGYSVLKRKANKNIDELTYHIKAQL